MNWNQIENAWPDYQESAQRYWSRLTERQVAATAGNQRLLSACVQHAYGIPAEESERQIADWLMGLLPGRLAR